MSKSKGNVVNPKEVADTYGLENFRYFMLREVPFGQDGDFSQKALIDRINSDLGNELGNLLNRIIGMSGKYSDFAVTSKDVSALHVKEIEEAQSILDTVENYLNELQTNRYLEDLWKVLSLANQSITVHEPWVKMKEGKSDEAMAVVALVANLLAKVAVLLSPVMPKTCATIAQAMGFEINTQTYTKLIVNKELLADFVIEKVPPLFPRIEEELMETPEPEPKPETRKVEKKQEETAESIITFDQFIATKLVIGTILEAEEVEGSDRLLKLKVDLGEAEARQVIAGIKEHYNAADLVDTQVCVVANLKPRKVMGLLSQGMLLAAKDDEGLSLMRPEKRRKSGSLVG